MPDERGEFERIRSLIAALPESGADVRTGPGDDAAVVRPTPGRELALTTDAFVVGRHFRAEWSSAGNAGAWLAEGLGARLAAANASDLAAMAVTPRWALISAGIDASDRAAAWFESFQRGMVARLAADGATLVGGNLTRANGAEWFSLTLVGEVEPGTAWKRSGAREGDAIAVTGSPGRSGAFVEYAQARSPLATGDAPDARLVAWLRPASRVALARALAASGAVTAAIDLSDGFRGDLAHLCEASGLGAEIDAAAWPVDDALEDLSRRLIVARRSAGNEADSSDAALAREIERLRLGPSDDYELLLAVAPDRRAAVESAAAAAGAPIAFVGRFAAHGRGLTLRRESGSIEPLPGAGYDHFGER